MQYRNQQLIKPNSRVRFSRNENRIESETESAAFFSTSDFRTHGTCITEAVLCTSEGMKENWMRVEESYHNIDRDSMLNLQYKLSKNYFQRLILESWYTN